MLISAGAFSAGSFAIPFGKVRKWKWETYWFIYSFGAYVLFPLVACIIFTPGFAVIFKSIPHAILLRVFLLGAIYGIGNLSFGLSLSFLGISLGYALSLGLILAIGTLIPPMIDGRLKVMVSSSGGNLLIAGVARDSGLWHSSPGMTEFCEEKKLPPDKDDEIQNANINSEGWCC